MEQTPGQNSTPASEVVDKSRVLDIKPLRSLAPVFPSSANNSPYACFPPAGPFTSGYAPFYPFSGSAAPENVQTSPGAYNQPVGYATPISAAVPINSYRTANGDAETSGKKCKGRARKQYNNGVAEEDGYSDGDDPNVQYSSRGRKIKGKSQKRGSRGHDINSAITSVDTDAILNNILKLFPNMKFDATQVDGDREAVENVLLINSLLRRKISQIEDAKESAAGISKRPDLKAAAILMNKGIRTNSRKRIGVSPGVEVGDIYYFRMELCIVGLHSPSMAGIDYMIVKDGLNDESLAVSIVSSGGYDDNNEDGDVLVYSGQGGNLNNVRDKEVTDQKLERGNLALEKSLHRGNEVRVIRGLRDQTTVAGKIYVYDGIYKIQESWVDKGKAGFDVFKFKLVRVPGQPEAFTIWKSVQQWKEGSTARVGMILPDLTSGAENLPVSLVNDVDDEKGPAYFTYCPVIKFAKPVTSAEPLAGCACHSGCLPSSPNCSCVQRNEGYLAYTSNGVLVNPKPLVNECGPSCQCPPTCRNRVSQGGLKVRLEVFKTKNRGWGLRSWDPIRVGGYICEYAGEIVGEEHGDDKSNQYIFNTTRKYQLPGLLPGESNGALKIPFPLIINAKDVGNVARFMNHSCSPNVLWQAVQRANNKECDLRIAFYAIKNIPPMTELTFDYGMVPPEKLEQRKKKCLCGSPKCRGHFC